MWHRRRRTARSRGGKWEGGRGSKQVTGPGCSCGWLSERLRRLEVARFRAAGTLHNAHTQRSVTEWTIYSSRFEREVALRGSCERLAFFKCGGWETEMLECGVPGRLPPCIHLLCSGTLWLFSSEQRIGAERMTGAGGAGCEVPEAVGGLLGFSCLPGSSVFTGLSGEDEGPPGAELRHPGRGPPRPASTGRDRPNPARRRR